MRLHLGLPFLLATACGSGTVSIGDGPSRTCPGFALSAEALDFQDALVTAPSELTLTVTNDCLADEGDLDLSVAVAGDPAFSVSPGEATVAPADSVDLVVTYEAASYEPASAELQIATGIEALGTVVVPLTATPAVDQDGDGFAAIEAGGEDCDDTDPSVFPGAPEVWYDGIDGNCDGADDFDQDGDGARRLPEGEDCDDTNPEVVPGAEELTDTFDNDCDGWVDEDALRPGDILITEVMNDPVAVFDTSGEWFELVNTSERPINLVNWAIRDFNGDSVTIDGSLIVEPGGRVVLGVEGDPTRNGGVTVDYVYDRDAFDLENTTDVIGLEVAGEVVALVEYDSSWRQVAGRSMQLDREFEAARSASVKDFWCLSSQPIGDSADQGTPGTVNRLCPNVDHDGDGFSLEDGDCDDTDPGISPGADEVWNGIDDDCDGTVDVSERADVESAYLEGDRRSYLGFAAGLSQGDIDHDGDLELIVSTTRNGGTLDGLVYTFEAGDASTWADPAFDVDEARIDVSHTYDAMGLLSPTMADNDGDGNVDLVLGGSAGIGTRSSTQPAVLLFGDGSLRGNLDEDDATAAWLGLRGNYDSNRIASHLDVNGDGSHEILFVDPNATTSVGRFAGAVLLLDADGASGTADLVDSVEEEYGGSRLYGRFGSAIDGGDLDGDGYDDMIGCGITESSNQGACYLLFGESDYPASGTMADIADLEVTGRSSLERFGAAHRAGIADFDGDSKPDLVLGNPYRDEAMVFLDVGDRTGSYDTSDADVVLRPRNTPSFFGMGLTIGDFDGDSTDDLAVGAPDTVFYTGADDRGQVWVWLGGDIASATSALTESDAWASVRGGSVGDAFGQAVLAADLEDDGVDDLVITAPAAGTDLGRISILLLD